MILKYNTILFWNIAVLMFSSILIVSLIPLTPILLDTVMPLNESRPRFFAIEVEFRVNKDDYFLPILCYTTVIILVGANVVMSVDAMHIACTAHACSLFAAVSKRIENLISKANHNKESNKCRYCMNMELDPLNEKLMYREYIICLKKHQLAIEFVNTLNSSYQGISLLLLILLIGTISLIATRTPITLTLTYDLVKVMTLIKETITYVERERARVILLSFNEKLRRIIMLENFLREYNVNRIFLLSMGLWPFQNKSIRNFLRTFFFLIEISYCPFEMLLLHDHLDNPQMIFDASYQFMMSMSFIGRQINEFWNHDKLRRLYKAIDQHWDIFTNDMEVQVMKNYSMLSRKFTKYYSMLMFSSMLILSLIPLTPILLDTVMPLNESRPRFFAIEVEFRVNKDDYFLPILCYTTVIILVGANVVMSVDAMHIVCTAHACSLFAAVSKRIGNLISTANNNKESSKCRYCMNMELDPLNEKLMYREYIICLKKHQLAIEFVNILESSYQGISLLALILLVGTISLIATRVSVRNYSYKMSYININIYAAEWYKFSPRLKSLLIITLYRSNVPCGLKAGNMIPLSIATFAAVSKMLHRSASISHASKFSTRVQRKPNIFIDLRSLAVSK
ncbi:PREDICTED: LOW QUALITY PROTEIN: uncharacterized protein LOC108684456 [Atta colombica]|uniref:LOW QUALITY PROTEIN: uncharacterized protein LOC108684456 n=1 Tax=Atta colombica TaxID=520822 RepID=UPI00084C2015|nr:PREDICTED: LOW QUALITY PROTEIN: uncharacterized protein LOC108684456 [Atta colombica]